MAFGEARDSARKIDILEIKTPLLDFFEVGEMHDMHDMHDIRLDILDIHSTLSFSPFNIYK